jgi:chromosome segregation ATPase
MSITDKARELLEKIKQDVQQEYDMGGLNDGLYGDYASDVAIRFSAELVKEIEELKNKLQDAYDARDEARYFHECEEKKNQQLTQRLDEYEHTPQAYKVMQGHVIRLEGEVSDLQQRLERAEGVVEAAKKKLEESEMPFYEGMQLLNSYKEGE